MYYPLLMLENTGKKKELILDYSFERLCSRIFWHRQYKHTLHRFSEQLNHCYRKIMRKPLSGSKSRNCDVAGDWLQVLSASSQTSDIRWNILHKFTGPSIELTCMYRLRGTPTWCTENGVTIRLFARFCGTLYKLAKYSFRAFSW